MQDPFPPLTGPAERARLVRRLRSAVGAAIRDGHTASAQSPAAAIKAKPLLHRLEQIGRELEQMEAAPAGESSGEPHPFWIDLLTQLEAQTPCGKSPPPEKISR
ncbi:hypothetical protein [Sphingomonas arenae]|uniref:hypothetical protein n=1 Tax=Sphingomonas arenae TaxID=2812555 RepID=UPI0019678C3E|nr:hypothetical protein [Sphingomonas arenae]